MTAREYAVARLISEGMTNAEIADALGIAPKTASSHVEHILAKLGASRRAEIATWASNVERSSGTTSGTERRPRARRSGPLARWRVRRTARPPPPTRNRRLPNRAAYDPHT